MSPLTTGERALCGRLLGPDGTCLLLSGSYARGWQHSHSDVDLIVIGVPPLRADEPPGTEADAVTLRVCYLDGKRWEVEYYSSRFVEQLIEAIGIAAEAADCGTDPMRVIGSYELGRALRLHGGVALSGESQAQTVQEQIHAAGLARLVTRIAVDSCDAALDDALGLLAGGDVRAAVLAASSAVGHAVDAFLASHGELWPGVKWRYRKYMAMLEAQPEAGLTLDADACWRLLTLADFDPEKSERWVYHAVAHCQNVLFYLTEMTK